MKKLIILVVISLLLSGWLFSQEKRDLPHKFIPPGLEKKKFQENTHPFKENLKDILETKKRLKEIERETIENDPELKKISEEIKILKKELREKLNEKLKNDQEYQNLKVRIFEIWEKLEKKGKGVKK
jgi:predicted nuclease with TOPRIM domain